MIDFIRKHKQEEELTEEALSNLETKEDEKTLDTEIIKRKILEGMATLKPKNREIFELSKFEGLTHKEIASHLNISERAVEDNVARALKLLKGYFDNSKNDF